MSVSTHLSDTASKAVLSATETSSIATSISTLSTRLVAHFGTEVTTHFKFGSFTRGTILPRSIDQKSDVDYMVVFNDAKSKPQTYLDRLKRFVEAKYAKSEIYQSSPTIVLELSHIRFELVPAISNNNVYNIPAPASGWQDWIATYPNVFNQTLTDANIRHNYNLKPMIRLMKYWNARSGYVFPSFILEQKLVNTALFRSSLKEYLFDAINRLYVDWNEAQWRQEKVSQAKAIINTTLTYEQSSMPAHAENEIKKLFPSIK